MVMGAVLDLAMHDSIVNHDAEAKSLRHIARYLTDLPKTFGAKSLQKRMPPVISN
jgi:hypothetical protein